MLDVLVLGAGPAGTASASVLARRGRSVVCLERAFFPRHAIGESLLPRANQLLAKAGLYDAVAARGYQTKRGATFFQDARTERFCFADGLPGEPESTFQVPRDDFDQTLATAAREAGVDVRFGQEVGSVRFEADRAIATVRDVETGATSTIEAAFVLDASGAARVLPRLLGTTREHGIPTRTAIFGQVEGDLRPEGDEAGDIWVCLHPRGAWLWVIPFSNGRTSIGAVGDPSLFAELPGGDRDKLLELVRTDPAASKRLAKSVPVTRTGRLEAWSRSSTQLSGARWAVAGDSGEFLDPVFSSGVTLALESGTRVAELTDRALAGEAVDWDAHERAVKRSGAVFRAFVDGWYRGDVPRIFFSHRKIARVKRFVTSILAGHVTNEDNPLVRDPEGSLGRLVRMVEAGESGALAE